MIFHTMEETPKEGQQYFAETVTYKWDCNKMDYIAKRSWSIFYFNNKFPFKIIRWFSVDDLEKAEKRINHLENKRGSRCPCRFAKRRRCLYST